MWSLSRPAVGLKNFVWSLWDEWVRLVPIKRGRYRFAAILRATIGLPVRSLSGLRIELFPASSADDWLQSKMDCDTAIHEAMGEYLEDGDVFIDVGANIGLFSILAASKFGAEVYAFEPSERELARLARNATLNEVAIKTFQVALGSVATVGSMHLEAAGNHMMNRVASGQLSGAGMARCEIRRLDEVLLPEIFRRARLVKIDVEGYEMNVLLGMSGAFEFLQHAALVVEITPRWLAENGSSADSLYEFVTARGWRPRVGLLQVEQWDEIFDPPSPLGRDGQLQMD